MVAGVWVWSTQATSGRAMCTALWMTKPGGLTVYGLGSTIAPL